TIDFFEVRYNLNNVPYIEYPNRVTRIGNCNGCTGSDGDIPYHNNLLGLQGGFNYSYYHLGLNEYEAAINANNPSADNPFLTEADIPNISTFKNDIVVSLKDGKNLGKYLNGDTIPSTGMTFEEFANDIA